MNRPPLTLKELTLQLSNERANVADRDDRIAALEKALDDAFGQALGTRVDAEDMLRRGVRYDEDMTTRVHSDALDVLVARTKRLHEQLADISPASLKARAALSSVEGGR
jgi:hypothetical protein